MPSLAMLGDPAAALKAFDEAIKIAINHAKLGDLYLVADHPAEAAEQYKKALDVIILEKNPRFTGARLRLGVVLRRKGDEAGARDEWERCAAEDPGDMRAKAYLAALGGGAAAAS